MAAVISSGWVSHSRVEPSTSASSSVTVPVGKSPRNVDNRAVSHTATRPLSRVRAAPPLESDHTDNHLN